MSQYLLDLSVVYDSFERRILRVRDVGLLHNEESTAQSDDILVVNTQLILKSEVVK